MCLNSSYGGIRYFRKLDDPHVDSRQDARHERPMSIFCLYIIKSALKVGKRHSTIVLSPYLSSMMRCERIKPDIFDINRDMPIGPAVSFCSTGGCLGYVTVVRYICHGHVGGSSSTYYLLIQRKTRS